LVILLVISKNARQKRYVGPMSNFLAAFCVLKPFLEISCSKNRMIAVIIPQWDRQTDGHTVEIVTYYGAQHSWRVAKTYF